MLWEERRLEDSETRIGILDYETSQSCDCLKPAEEAYCWMGIALIEVNQQQATVG